MSQLSARYLTIVKSTVAVVNHFYADPDPHQSDEILRSLVLQGSILSLQASIVSVYGPPRL